MKISTNIQIGYKTPLVQFLFPKITVSQDEEGKKSINISSNIIRIRYPPHFEIPAELEHEFPDSMKIEDLEDFLSTHIVDSDLRIEYDFKELAKKHGMDSEEQNRIINENVAVYLSWNRK